VIVPIYRDDESKAAVTEYIAGITKKLQKAGVRYHIDARETLSPGFKFHDWEMKGVPLRLEIGPRDVKNGKAVVARRDTGEKNLQSADAFCASVNELLETIQQDMFEARKAFREANTRDVADYGELKSYIEDGGFARAYWDGSSDDEKRIQEECKATIRCIPFDQPEQEGTCFYTGRKTRQRVILAKAY
jgi:prolyl-tRNA synthetase